MIHLKRLLYGLGIVCLIFVLGAGLGYGTYVWPIQTLIVIAILLITLLAYLLGWSRFH